MALASDPKQLVRLAGPTRRLWAFALALCPVSYLTVALIRYCAVAGWLAAFFAAVSLVEVAADRARRLPGVQSWASGLGAAIAVGLVAARAGGVSAGAAMLYTVALIVEIGFLWACIPMLVRDLGGAEFDPGACVRGETRGEEGCSRTALSFVLFFSLLVFGAGAMWNRGEVWAPKPVAWVLAMMALTLGAMLLERLGFLERSARHGNLALPGRSHQRWIASAALVLVLAALLAAAGPWKAPRPQDTSRAGTRTIVQPVPQPLQQQLQQQLERISTSVAGAAATAASMPRLVIALWLFLFLLLLILIILWLFSRSRAARWILRLFSWFVARAVRMWNWLRAQFRRALAPSPAAKAPEESTPIWARDPFFDIFAHPEILTLLTAREVVVRTYHLFLTLAEVLGQERRSSQTPLEYARSLQFEASEARAALGALTWAYVRAMYGGRAADVPAPSAIQEAWGTVTSALLSHVSPEELALRKQAYLRRRA